MSKERWITRQTAGRYIHRFGGGLYPCLINHWWMKLRNKHGEFVCYVSN